METNYYNFNQNFWLQKGDIVECEIDELGKTTNRME